MVPKQGPSIVPERPGSASGLGILRQIRGRRLHVPTFRQQVTKGIQVVAKWKIHTNGAPAQAGPAHGARRSENLVQARNSTRAGVTSDPRAAGISNGRRQSD